MQKYSTSSLEVVCLDDYRKSSQSNSAKTILCVDEDIVTLNSLKKMFEAKKYKVILASDAMEVSKIIENNVLNLILLDAQLSWLDGYDLCSLLKSSEVFKNLPIILLSKFKEEEDIQRGFEAGCDKYIVKPFNVLHLQEIAENFMS